MENPRRRALAGYRLHLARLARAQTADVVRTQKYPLACTPEVQHALWNLLAPISDVLNGSAPGTLIHFTVVALAQGGVITSKPARLRPILEALYPDSVTSAETTWARQVIAMLPADVRQHVASAPNRVADFLLTTRRSSQLRAAGELPTGVVGEWAALWGTSIEALPEVEAASRFLSQLQARIKAGVPCTGSTVRECFERAYAVTLPPLPPKPSRSDAGAFATFAILPGVTPMEPDIRRVVLNHLRPLAVTLGVEVADLMGTSENQNGLSDFWGNALVAFRQSEDDAMSYLEAATRGLWRDNTDELRRRMRVIREAALAVPDDCGPMAVGWRDYRSLTGGRLQGWVSNFLSRIDQFATVFADHTECWRKLIDGIAWDAPVECGDAAVSRERLEWMADASAKLREQATEASESLDAASLELYEQELRDVRERLEYWSRVGMPVDRSVLTPALRASTEKGDREAESSGVETNIRLDAKYVPALLPRYPKFIGEARDLQEGRLREAWDRAINVLAEADRYVTETCKHNPQRDAAEFWTEEVFRKQLDSLLRAAQAASPDTQHKIVAYLATWTTARPSDLIDKELAFFVSPYSRQRRTPLTLKRSVPTYAAFVSEIEREFAVNGITDAADAEQALALSDPAGRRSAIEHVEIRKRLWALRLMALPDQPALPPTPPLLVALPVARFLTQPTRRVVQRVIQAGYGGELRGALSLLSRASYLDRAVIQTTNGEQTALAYLPRAAKSGWQLQKKWRDLLEQHGVDSTKSPGEIAAQVWVHKKQESLLPALTQLPHGWGAVLDERRGKSYPAQLSEQRTGEVLTFAKSEAVDRFTLKVEKNVIVLPIRTSRYQTQFMDRFLLSADGKHKAVGLAGGSIILEREQRIDWQRTGEGMRPHRKAGETAVYFAIPWELRRDKEKKAAKPVPKNVLGIDLGEYGFGWAVVSPTGQLVESGFQAEERLAALRRGVATWKDQQATGNFLRPSTRLERMREAAIGRVRNEIHALCLRHDAIPVYEFEVSRFEVGSQRLRRLYASLKKADVPEGGVDADLQEAVTVWGSKKRQGHAIGAAYTSQTCRRCGRCATHAIQRKGGTLTVAGQRLQLDGDHHGVVRVDLADGRYPAAEINRAIYAKLRMAGSGYGSTQDQFECPYNDCRNVCHADEQAAHNIALKWLWHSSQKGKKLDSLALFMERSAPRMSE